MDLADLWGQHKKFILAVAGTLLLLLVGRGVLASNFPVEEPRRFARGTAAAMTKSAEIPDRVVTDLDAEVEGLRGRWSELARGMQYVPAQDFVLKPGESNPRAYFFTTLRKMQRALVDAAEKQDIRVPEKLGLKDTSPTDPEEIRRTLLALSVIQQVLIDAIGAGVRRVEAIHIEEEQRGRGRGFLRQLSVDFTCVGGERSIRALVAALVDGAARGEAPWLAVDRARLRPVKGEDGMLELSLSLAALEIAAESGEEAR